MKVALVTGSSRGIGRAIVLCLASRGFSIVVNYTSNHEAAQETAEQCQKQATQNGHSIQTRIIRANVGKAEERETLIAEIQRHFGRIDLLVNNAGIASIERIDILKTKETNYDHLMNVNLKAPFFLTQSIAKWMIELKIRNPKRMPKIINIGSISAFTASIHRADYCLSKTGIGMMTKLFAVRLAEYGIAVYEIRPGIIATDMTKPVKAKYDRLIESGISPIRRWGKPEDVGNAVATIAEGNFAFSTGEVFHVDGGFHIRQL